MSKVKKKRKLTVLGRFIIILFIGILFGASLGFYYRLTNDNVSKLEDMLNNLETKKLSTNKANEQKKINGYQVHVASYDQNDKYLFSTTIRNEYIIIDDDVYKSSIDQNKKIITYLKQKLNIQKGQ